MGLKLRFLTIFIITFVVFFAVLNSRFVAANVRFWLLTGADQSNLVSNQKITPLPVELSKPQTALLPNQATLVINGLGISAPIIFNVPDDARQIYDQLENGIVHYSSTPKPGLPGVSVILGHSSAYPWYKGRYGSVFALLGHLKPGDRFYVQYSDGRRFNYVVKQSIVFRPLIDDPRLTQIENNPRSSLVLVSCWPVGTNYKRIAVQAELL